jgi:hypothetical protein
LRALLLSAVDRSAAPMLFIHAANDYSIAPGKALASEMRRLGKPSQLVVYPRFGRDARDGHNLVYRSVRTWERDVFAFLAVHVGASTGVPSPSSSLVTDGFCGWDDEEAIAVWERGGAWGPESARCVLGGNAAYAHYASLLAV